jgi:hypothetical protein
MKNLSKLSKKATEFCELSGFDVDAVKSHMRYGCFNIQKCETKKEMKDAGVDFSYPYVIWNPYSLSLTD